MKNTKQKRDNLHPNHHNAIRKNKFKANQTKPKTHIIKYNTLLQQSACHRDEIIQRKN